MSNRSQRITSQAISSAQLDALIARKPILIWCQQLRGFGLRISPPSKKYPNGKCSYIVQKHVGGRKSKEIRFTFGEYPSLPLAEAYNKALALISQIRNGENPSQQKKSLLVQRRQEYQLSKTNKFSVIFETYRQKRLEENNKNSVYFTKEIISNFNKYVIPVVGNCTFKEIQKEDIKALLKAIPTFPMRRKIEAQLKPLFKYALTEDIVTSNPFDGIEPTQKSPPRERILSREELKAFWLATQDIINSPKPLFGYCYRALLLSAARLREIANIEFSEIDNQERLITIASTRMKMRKPHIVPITDFLNETLSSTPKKHSQFVFSYGEHPINGFSASKKLLDKQMRKYLEAPLEPFVLHSFRHTFNTVMAAKGENLDHIDLCLAHIPRILQGTQKHYNHYAFLKERRVVMERWESYIREITL